MFRGDQARAFEELAPKTDQQRSVYRAALGRRRKTDFSCSLATRFAAWLEGGDRRSAFPRVGQTHWQVPPRHRTES